MKKFILKREMIYTERAEVEAESWDDARAMIYSDSVEFDVLHDDQLHDSSIEFVGEADQ